MRRILLTSLAFTCVLGAKTFTLERVLPAPFPTELVAAPGGGKVAWVVNESGARNIWVAIAHDFKGVRATCHLNPSRRSGVRFRAQLAGEGPRGAQRIAIQPEDYGLYPFLTPRLKNGASWCCFDALRDVEGEWLPEEGGSALALQPAIETRAVGGYPHWRIFLMLSILR
jgi:hypothetical protein